MSNEMSNISESDDKISREIISRFSSVSNQSKIYIIHNMLQDCTRSQLSNISNCLESMLRVDFLSELPSEISTKVLGYTDASTLGKVAQVCRKWSEFVNDNKLWYRLCRQHIDRKCTKCGWGLPLMIKKRKRTPVPIDSDQIPQHDYRTHSDNRRQNPQDDQIAQHAHHAETAAESTDDLMQQGWKDIYRERLVVERNWRRANYKEMRLNGHSDKISCIQINERSSVVVSASFDQTMRVWNLETGKCDQILQGHTDAVTCFQFDDSKLISGSLDGMLKIWSTNRWSCLRTWTGHETGVNCLHYNERVLATGGLDGCIKVWNIAQKTSFSLNQHNSQINKLQIVGNMIFSAANDNSICMWNMEHKNIVRQFLGHTQPVCSFHLVMPHEHSRVIVDDKYLNTCKLFSASHDFTIKNWDLTNGQSLYTVYGHTRSVNSVSASFIRFLSCSSDGSVCLWDDTGKMMYTLSNKNPPFHCCQMSDTKAAAGDDTGTLILWNFSATKSE